MDEPIEMKHVLDAGARWRHMTNTIEPSMCGGDAALCQLLWPFFYYYYERRTFFSDGSR